MEKIKGETMMDRKELDDARVILDEAKNEYSILWNVADRLWKEADEHWSCAYNYGGLDVEVSSLQQKLEIAQNHKDQHSKTIVKLNEDLKVLSKVLLSVYNSLDRIELLDADLLSEEDGELESLVDYLYEKILEAKERIVNYVVSGKE